MNIQEALTYISVREPPLLPTSSQGCGRGGGASYISRHLNPYRYVALDLAEKNIRFCNDYHGSEDLSFVKGDAEALPFDDGSFDALLNVESSRCYGNIERFFSEAFRVLCAGAGFLIDEEENITSNVVRSLDLDDERRRSVISRKIPRFLKRAFGEFAAVTGSCRYNEFASGDMQYVSMLLRKPAGDAL